MDKEMIPKFASKDEELDYWKSQALKYKKRYVTLMNIVWSKQRGALWNNWAEMAAASSWGTVGSRGSAGVKDR